MKIAWEVGEQDVATVRALYAKYEQHHLVQDRWEVNVCNPPTTVSKEEFWQAMVMCLLTTRQPSGPESAVMRFMAQAPFPLSYGQCTKEQHLADYCEASITRFRGIRRGKTIGGEINANLARLEAGGWESIFGALRGLNKASQPGDERCVARLIDERLKGFGPKQSRNLLQTLGLTRYEIPVDSRVTRWLNGSGFPITLRAASLQDEEYYAFVLDGVQVLCQKSGILPCMLDAVIFVSFDDKTTV